MIAPECRHCGRVSQWHKRSTGRGWVVVPWCLPCNRHPTTTTRPVKGDRTTWSPQAFLPKVVARMPELPGPATGRCSVCGKAGPVEEHHFAPRALFGADAEAWPVVDLCTSCHDRWHRLVWSGP